MKTSEFCTDDIVCPSCEKTLDHLDFQIRGRVGLTVSEQDYARLEDSETDLSDLINPCGVIVCPECGVHQESMRAFALHRKPAHWDDIDPEFPARDWRAEVMNEDTRLGYPQWVRMQQEVRHHNDGGFKK